MGDDDTVPTVREVTTFLHQNGCLARKKRQFFIQTQKLKSLVKRAVLDQALRASTPSQTTQILKTFEEILLSKVSDDPEELFGSLLVTEDRLKVLHNLRANLLEKIERNPFTSQDLQELNTQLVKVIEGTHFMVAAQMIKKVQIS